MTIPDRLSSALSDRYRFDRELGAGGMATVYLAHDLKHDRDVAIKLLHPDLGAALGGERFLSEIRTTARLQHPHILPLLDSGAADGLLYYVMPLVTGETLRARLEREKQLPLEDAIRIAREVASALDYAHRQGVIHRDIKPENILLHDGQALVADFGIALAVQTAGGARMTQTGLSLGTPQYMSPEQAMGEKTIDARSDVYALGAVTYEMLTGEPPFTGATVQAIVAKVLTERPTNPMSVRDTVPPHVAASVLKALAKLPADRFASTAQFSEALIHPEIMSAAMHSSMSPTQANAATSNPSHSARTGIRRHVFAAPMVWLLLIVAAGAATMGWIKRDSTSLASTLILPIEPPAGIDPLPGTVMALSSDGTSLAFIGVDSTRVSKLFVQSLDGGGAQVISSGIAASPSFSPDGKSVAYYNVETQSLEVRSLAGGQTRRLVAVAAQRGTTWAGDSTIVFGAGGTLRRVFVRSAKHPEIALDVPPGTRLVQPFGVSSNVVLSAMTDSAGSADEPQLVAVTLDNGHVTLLGVQGTRPGYADPGILTFMRGGSLWGVEFDAGALKVRGTPRLIADENAEGRVSTYAVSRSGVIALQRGAETLGELVLVDRRGASRTVLDEKRAYRWPRFSPDGARIAVGINSAGRNLNSDIWIVGRNTGSIARVTADSLKFNPEWARDERYVLFASRQTQGGAGSILRAPADGGVASVLVTRPNPMYESALTPDGRTLVWREDAPGTGRDILSAPLDSPTVVRPIRNSTADERGFSLSPDGQWLAFTSNETGVPQVYVSRVEPNGPRWPVSRRGGSEPRWIRTGELFYRRGDSVMVSRVTLGTEPTISDPTFVFAGRYVAAPFEPLWDVSPDGLSFVMVRETNGTTRPRQLLMLNWIEAWRARVVP